jgi:amidophosphoribosyltransferase
MCGVFGIWGHTEASNITYLGLHGLQHRGQESAGIVTSDGSKLHSYKRMGRVADAFDADALGALPGSNAIGHVRYSTAGSSNLKNAQPFAVEFGGTSLAIAHNGNLTNAGALREQLEADGALFHSTMDTEIVVHLLARSKGKLVDRVKAVAPMLEGAYSLLILTPDELIAVRDPHGFRPLVLGQVDGGYVLSSETCALRLVEATPMREIEPGEIFCLGSDVPASTSIEPKAERPHHCIFEHVYFARPDTELYGESVYEVRHATGRRLASESPVAGGEVVISVPDSGTTAALGFAQASELPFEMGLIRSHYAGRTFIEPSSSIRHFGVKLKLSPVASVIEGRSVVVVDDSLVRGTTSRKIIRMLREAGAREVHMRIACPPTTNPCFYGIDTPTKRELIASSHTIDDIRRFLRADSLAYLSVQGLRGSVRGGCERYCDACFTGTYPVAPPTAGRRSYHLDEHQ